MATNTVYQGRDYQTPGEAAGQQREEERDRVDRRRQEDKIQEYLRKHPSDSYATAHYKTRQIP